MGSFLKTVKGKIIAVLSIVIAAEIIALSIILFASSGNDGKTKERVCSNNELAAEEYVRIVNDLENRYGKGAIEGDVCTGLYIVRLIDFDLDGTNELLCAYNNKAGHETVNKYILYGYDGGLKVLVPESEVYVAGTDFSPMIRLFSKNGKTYLLTCPETESMSMDGDYLTVKDGEMVSGFSYFDGWNSYDTDFDSDGEYNNCKVNGRNATSYELRNAMEDFLSGGRTTDIDFYGYWGEDYEYGIKYRDLEETESTVYNLRKPGNQNESVIDGDVVYPVADVDDIICVNESGYLPDSGDRTYNGETTIDGDPDTCWIVNTEEDGASGAWIEYQFDGIYKVSGIRMINGNVYKDDYYFRNGHIKKFRLDFSGGVSYTFTADEIESRSVYDNEFLFDEPVNTSYVRLTIISSYIGSKEKYRTNSAMAEFEVF